MARPPKSFLKDTHPELAAELVDKSLLDKLATGSNSSVEWECSLGHRWMAKVYNRTNPKGGTGCPICAGKVVLQGFNDIATTNPDVARLCADPEDAHRYTESSNKKVLWRCDEGHEWTAPVSRLTVQGSRCPYCSGRLAVKGDTDLATTDPGIAAQLVDESLASSLKATSNRMVEWHCERDHVWKASPYDRVGKGSGCPYCTGRYIAPGETDLATVAPEYAATLANPEDAVRYGKGSDSVKLEWVCQNNPEHRWFATPSNRLKSDVAHGCPICDNKVVRVGENDLATTHPEVAAELADPAVGKTVTAGSGKPVEWVCEKGHRWTASPYHRTAKHATGCPECDLTGTSKAETELADLVRHLVGGAEVLVNDFSVLPGGYELDIVVPSKSIAVEYNGCRWHSEVCGKPATYHADKRRMCEDVGYRLIQVWEDDWFDRRDLVVRMLASCFGSVGMLVELGVGNADEYVRRFSARKLDVGGVSGGPVSSFLNANSLDGDVRFDRAFALFDCDGRIRSALCLTNRGAGVWEVVRYATLGVVHGGFSRLLKYAVADIERSGGQVGKLVGYTPDDRSDGSLCKAAGFKLVAHVEPSHSYVGNPTKWRRVTSDDIMSGRLTKDWVVSPNWSEHETALANGMYRIYDAGSSYWEKELVPFEDGSEMAELHIKMPTDAVLGKRAISRYVRYFQQDVFYKVEKALWRENGPYRGTYLRSYMIENRCRYLGKRLSEITAAEMLRGFRISGVHRGYTVFDTELFERVVNRYGIESVYDPCAGWGERMLWCYANGIGYEGVDVNVALEPGYGAMMSHFAMTGQSASIGDGASHIPSGSADAVITCPPYGDIEIYSDAGAENLPYSAFMCWWGNVVEVSALTGARYFCFQVNAKYRDAMCAVVEDAGFRLVDELSFKSEKRSHFIRAKGDTVNAKAKETMLVFER